LPQFSKTNILVPNLVLEVSMRDFKVCTAIRNKDLEDEIIEIIKNEGWQHSHVNVDDITNEHRRGALFFVVEDNYTSILDFIELHNSCRLNFLPVIILSSKGSKHSGWADHVRYTDKYFRASMEDFKPVAVQVIKTMMSLVRLYKYRVYSQFNDFVSRSFDGCGHFHVFINDVLKHMLDLLYAERGSIMLLNRNRNLVIEASTKKNLIGLEVEPKPDSVSWTVVNTGQPVFVENIENDTRFKKNQGYAKDYFMSLPIIVNGQVEGALNLSDKMVALLFDRSDEKNAMRFLKILEPYLYIEKLNKCINAFSNSKL